MNKFRNIQLEGFTRAARPPEKANGAFNGGIDLSRPPQALELFFSPDLERTRVDKGVAHQDYGVVTLGTSPGLRIQGLGEHRFVLTSGDIFLKIFRIYRQSDTYIMVESWDGSSWSTEHDSTSLPLLDVLLSIVSYFDAVFIADGDTVFHWSQTNSLNDYTDDFTTDNALVDEGDYDDATISPAGAYLEKYTVHYDITISGPSGGGAGVTISIEHDGEEIAEEFHPLEEDDSTSRSDYMGPLSVKIERTIANNDDLRLKLKNISYGFGVERTNNFSQDTGTPLFKATKTPETREGVGDVYLYSFTLSGTGESQIDFYTDDGGGWDLEESETFPAGDWEWPISKVGMSTGSRFGLHVSSGVLAISYAYVTWNEPYDVTVHGLDTTDVENGVTYQVEGSPVNTLVKLDKDPGAPTDYLVARYLGVFADRLIALQVDGDYQKIACSVSGDPEDWIGTGSDETILQGVGDPVDELMGLKALASNVAALFRFRSIMRVVPTGSATTPLGYFRWIDNLGTESPFSVAGVPGGLIFLGHDRMVYYLTEGGLTPIGMPIQDELEQSVGVLGVVEGEYDPISKCYTLAVPGPSGSSTKIGWIFNFQRFASGEGLHWQRHTRTLNRLVLIEGKDLYFIGDDNFVRKFDRDSVVDGAYWTSPMLNRENPMGDYTLKEVAVRYMADGATTLEIEGSGDGGETWEEGELPSLDLSATDGKILRVFQTLNITGPDLRFKVSLPSDEKVFLVSWQAKLVDRSELESD
jgi:hypothetical protein